MDKLPHIGLTVGSVSPDVLVCGDPGRATRIAAQLDDVELLGELREYRSYRGTFAGKPVTVCSHGIGAPGAAIAFEELIAAGARRIIRVGTCGGLQPDIRSGDWLRPFRSARWLSSCGRLGRDYGLANDGGRRRPFHAHRHCPYQRCFLPRCRCAPD